MADVILKISTDDKGNAALERLDKNVGKVNKKLKNTSNILGSLLKAKAIISSLVQVKVLVSDVTSEYIKWEKSIKGIEAIAGVTGKSLDAFKSKSRELATQTEHSATKIADAMLEISKMGFDPEGTLEAISPILDMATVSMTDLRYAALNTITVLKSFNMDQTEASVQRVADSVAIALNQTSLDFESLMESMKFVAPVANQMNVSLEETLELLGTLSDVGLRGSLGGTSLKNILLNMMKPSENVKKALNEIGVAGKDVSQILTDMKDKNLTILDFLETFDKRAITGSLALAEMRDQILSLREQLDKAPGSVERMAEIIRSALGSQIEQVKNQLTEVGFKLIDAFKPAALRGLVYLKSVITNVTAWLVINKEALEDTVKSVVKFIAGTVKLAAKLLITKELFSDIAIVTVTFVGALNAVKVAAFAKSLLEVVKSLTLMRVVALEAGGGFTKFILLLNPMVATIIAAGLAIEVLLRSMEKLAEKANKQIEFASTGGMTSKPYINDLKEIINLHERQAELNKELQGVARPDMYDDSAKADALNTSLSERVRIQRELNEEIKSFREKYDIHKVIPVDDLEKVKGVYNNAVAARNAIADAAGGEVEKQEELDGLLKEYGDKIAGILKQFEGGQQKKEDAFGLQNELNDLFLYENMLAAIQESMSGLVEIHKAIAGFAQTVGGGNITFDRGEIPFDTSFERPDFSEAGDSSELDELRAQLAAIPDELKDIKDAEINALSDAYGEQARLLREWTDEVSEIRQQEYEDTMSMLQSQVNLYSNMALQITDIFQNMHQVRLNLMDAEFEERKNSALAWYNVETRLSEDGSLRKIVAEHKYSQEMENIENEKRQRAKETAEFEKRLAFFRSMINTSVAIVTALTDTTVPSNAARIAFASVAGGIGLAEQAAILSSNLRFGDLSGIVTGNGNGTSDSVNAKLSRGEVVVSNEDVRQAGGYGAIQQIIDKGVSYDNSKGVTIRIENFIGNREFAREITPEIKRELTRW